MIKGFVTIATGQERYYIMARNLLRSYRDNCVEPMNFALIADAENEYTQEFDKVIILENPTCSWMDKIELLKRCPYDENIFIDADCLIYRDINFLWELFNDADDFSCFGKALPLDSQEGWFTKEAEKDYSIHFITHLHGILYFIRRGKTIDQMYILCQQIISNYDAVTFKAFNRTLADEPVFALAMAVMNLYPIPRKPEYYCFVPFATSIQSNYLKRSVLFENPTDGKIKKCCIVHWGNQNTQFAKYRCDSKKLNFYYNCELSVGKKIKGWFLYQLNIYYFLCVLNDCIDLIYKWIKWFIGRVQTKLKRLCCGERNI